jgi:hypothetical protein
MSRPRKARSHHCITCRRTTYQSEAERSLIALHRLEHRRLDRRREQWRAYSKDHRKRDSMREAQYPHLVDAIGALHNLNCRGHHYGRRGNCTAIPVYRGEAA